MSFRQVEDLQHVKPREKLILRSLLREDFEDKTTV